MEAGKQAYLESVLDRIDREIEETQARIEESMREMEFARRQGWDNVARMHRSSATERISHLAFLADKASQLAMVFLEG